MSEIKTSIEETDMLLALVAKKIKNKQDNEEVPPPGDENFPEWDETLQGLDDQQSCHDELFYQDFTRVGPMLYPQDMMTCKLKEHFAEAPLENPIYEIKTAEPKDGLMFLKNLEQTYQMVEKKTTYFGGNGIQVRYSRNVDNPKEGYFPPNMDHPIQIQNFRVNNKTEWNLKIHWFYVLMGVAIFASLFSVANNIVTVGAAALIGLSTMFLLGFSVDPKPKVRTITFDLVTTGTYGEVFVEKTRWVPRSE